MNLCIVIFIIIVSVVSAQKQLKLNLAICFFGSGSYLEPHTKTSHGSIFENNDNITEAIQKNRQRYASKYGYVLVTSSDEQLAKGRKLEWAKVHLIKDTLSTYDWVLWVDSDAVFTNGAPSIESILVDNGVDLTKPFELLPSLYFSGDTNIANSGVLLFRKSAFALTVLNEMWNIETVVQVHGSGRQIGMGADNAALSVFLAGCNSSSTYNEMCKCYESSDVGYKNHAISDAIRRADQSTFAKIIPAHILRAVQPLPQISFNRYADDAKFIFHTAGLPAHRKVVLLGIMLGLRYLYLCID